MPVDPWRGFVHPPQPPDERLAKHGVTFDDARVAIEDPLARVWPDRWHSTEEERTIVMGIASEEQLLVVVVSVDADGMMRTISARRATKRERHAYEDR